MSNYWQILPSEIVEKIRETCFNNVNTNDDLSVKGDIESFVEDGLSGMSYPLFKYFQPTKSPANINLTTLKRALNSRGKSGDHGVYIKKGDKRYLDLLCFYSYRKNWSDTLKQLKLKESELEIRTGGIDENKIIDKKENKVDLSVFNVYLKVEEPKIDLEVSDKNKFKSLDITHLDKEYWDLLNQKNDVEKAKAIYRYYTHLDSLFIPEVVAQDASIVNPNDLFQVVNPDKSIEERTIEQVLNVAASENLFLIKIIAEGGVGKTTFLYWIAKQYCHQYNFLFIHQIHKKSSRNLLRVVESIPNTEKKPFIIIIDNVAYSETAKYIDIFFKDIREAKNDSLICIVAERNNRFLEVFEYDKLDRNFGGNVQTVQYISPDKDEIFDKLYFQLAKDNPQLKEPDIKEVSKNAFHTTSLTSVSEATYQLLVTLQLHYNINYKFDWHDWEEFIKNAHPKFDDLRHLFVMVVCFYQLGIRLPITFKSSFLGNGDSLLILSALLEFRSEKNPIVLADDNGFLMLKHEHVAKWFLKTNKAEILVRRVFQEFLQNINNTTSAKVFRKIRKRIALDEFKTSCLSFELDPIKALNIIGTYLEIPTISSDERKKMMNEYGMVLLILDREYEAIAVFKETISAFPKDNHSRDQLAKIYLQSPQTYQLALDQYIEIVKNNGEYALIEIYKLLYNSSRQKIVLIVNDHIELPIRLQHKLVRNFIFLGDIDLAIERLANISEITNDTAQCYYEIAQRLEFNKGNISVKSDYYLKAITLFKEINRVDNSTFVVGYAVFLFRIRAFPQSSQVISILRKNVTDDQRIVIEHEYDSKIQSVTKIFFPDLPNWRDQTAYTNYLYTQCEHANGWLKQTYKHSTLKSFVVLWTVRHHARSIPDLMRNVTQLLALCYIRNIDKMWNGLSKRDNRINAEILYDYLWNNNISLTKNELREMLNNLIGFKEHTKMLKVIRLVNQIVQISEFQEHSGFYRFRGNAKLHFGNYEDAFADYEMARKFCTNDRYENDQYFYNDKGATLYNIASLICQAIENKRPLKQPTVKNAIHCCNEGEYLLAKFRGSEIKKKYLINNFQDLRKRIQNINGM